MKAGEACAVVESVKAASDVYSPVSGKVIGRQCRAGSPTGAAQSGPLWSGVDVPRADERDRSTTPPLMSAADYAKYLADEAH